MLHLWKIIHREEGRGSTLNQSQKSSPHTENNEKRAWQAPTIEELDFSATEAAYIPGIPADLGIYTV
jgi:hypothetical protein